MAITQNRTLILRSIEEADNLCYLVEFESESYIKTFYKGENYNQALLIASHVNSWLRQHLDTYFDLIIEQPQGQGVIYLHSALDSFPEVSDDMADFYSQLCDEFETKKLGKMHDLNLLFRDLVNKNKLNQYQEHRFLKELKRRKHV